MSVREKIIKKIKEEGPISFHNYMEMALYYPNEGCGFNKTEYLKEIRAALLILAASL